MKSSHEFELKISQVAFDDLVDIQNDTFQVHGEKQWKDYENLLNKGLMQIRDYPYTGHGRDDIPKGYLASNFGEHVMIYRVDGNIVYLIRVLHGKMNFTFQF